MTNKVAEIGPRAFLFSDIKPNITVGDLVFVKWSNNKIYNAIVVDYNKEAISVGIEIRDNTWPYSKDNARGPDEALIKRNYK